MKENQLIKGNEYLYCPGSFDDQKFLQNYQGIFFVFKRVTNNFYNWTTQYIFTLNKQCLNIYTDVSEYVNDLELEAQGNQPIKDLSAFKSSTMILDDLSYVHTFSDKKMTKILLMYDFLLKKKTEYLYLLRKSKLFCIHDETFYETKLVRQCRKTLIFVKIRYFLYSTFLKLKRILKIIPLLLIFIKDTFLSTLKLYDDYKKAEYDVSFYEKNSLLTNTERDKALKKAKHKYNKKKNKYIEANKSIFALTIALFTCVFSIVQTAKTNSKTQRQIIDSQDKLTSLQIENQELRNKILLKDTELNQKNANTEIYKELIEINSSSKNEIEKLKKDIDEKLKSTKKEILDYINKKDNN